MQNSIAIFSLLFMSLLLVPNVRARGFEFIEQIEHEKLPTGLVAEKLLFQGCEPTDPIPAYAVYPKGQTNLPLVVLFHWFTGSKEEIVGWATKLAPEGFFVLAIDLQFHGERAIKGVLEHPDLPDLKDEFSIFVHQSTIEHGVRDFSLILDALRERKEIDLDKIGVAGISMGGSLASVLAWKESRISAVVSIVGAADFWWDVTKTPPGPKQEEMKNNYSPRLRRLVNSIDPLTRLELVPPKALLIINGRTDHLIDIKSMEKYAAKMRKHYVDFPERFEFRAEDAGHDVSGEWNIRMRRDADKWFIRHLKKQMPPKIG